MWQGDKNLIADSARRSLGANRIVLRGGAQVPIEILECSVQYLFYTLRPRPCVVTGLMTKIPEKCTAEMPKVDWSEKFNKITLSELK